MSEERVSLVQVKDKLRANRYQCQKCSHILVEAVQTTKCGHLLCELCMKDLLEDRLPVCPVNDCREPLGNEGGDELPYYPDNFVRREVKRLDIVCKWANRGCLWEGELQGYEEHLIHCNYAVSTSGQSDEGLCPLRPLGCDFETRVNTGNISTHLSEDPAEHLDLIAQELTSLKSILSTSSSNQGGGRHDDLQRYPCESLFGRDEDDYGYDDDPDDGYDSGKFPQVPSSEGNHQTEDDCGGASCHDPALPSHEEPSVSGTLPDFDALSEHVAAIVLDQVRREYKSLDEKMTLVNTKVTEVKRTLRLTDQRYKECNLSQIGNITSDGTILWKIKFKKAMESAREKHSSLRSSPFYTSRHGYKLCLQLYVMGHNDATSKYMSLFVNIMSGDYDPILKKPFHYNVTFTLKNQSSMCDVTASANPVDDKYTVDQELDERVTFGCPRFISHDELMNKGFIKEDSIFIKCAVNTDTVHQ